MTPFLEFLNDKALPGFALLKNARTSLVAGLGYQVSSFDEAHWSGDFDSLLQKIPKPELRSTKEAIELAGWRFSEDEIQNKQFAFNTYPNGLVSEANDFDLFGESYTIFWVALPEEEWLVETVLKMFDSSKKIDGQALKQVWEHTIDRIFFRRTEEMDVELSFFFEEVVSVIVEKINALPNAPDEHDWEALNDEPQWDED